VWGRKKHRDVHNGRSVRSGLCSTKNWEIAQKEKKMEDERGGKKGRKDRRSEGERLKILCQRKNV